MDNKKIHNDIKKAKFCLCNKCLDMLICFILNNIDLKINCLRRKREIKKQNKSI